MLKPIACVIVNIVYCLEVGTDMFLVALISQINQYVCGVNWFVFTVSSTSLVPQNIIEASWWSTKL